LTISPSSLPTVKENQLNLVAKDASQSDSYGAKPHWGVEGSGAETGSNNQSRTSLLPGTGHRIPELLFFRSRIHAKSHDQGSIDMVADIWRSFRLSFSGEGKKIIGELNQF
jgi:hypothetical protein